MHYQRHLIILTFLLAWTVGHHAHIPQAYALTAKQAYFNGESCYKELRNSPQKMKKRQNWLQCIEKFQQAYRLDPSGPWAPAGLYMSGKLLQELAQHSGKTSDQQQALDIYERIRKDFPDSRYREKAEKEIQLLTASGGTKKTKPPPKDAGKEEYLQAETCYNNLSQSPSKMNYRHNWLECAEKFHAIYRADPTGPWAAPGLFMAARLHEGLYQRSKRDADRRQALEMYQQIIQEFPDSRFKVMASLLIDGMPQAAGEKPAAEKDASTKTIEAESGRQKKETPAESSFAATAPDGLIKVENLRFWSNPNYSRVVIDASNETTYNHHLLKKDPAIDKPQRLYVDLNNCRLGENIKKIIPINDDLLINARAGQYTNDSVRVVIDIKSFQSYKIFSLQDPYRIVIDVRGSAGESALAEQPPPLTSDQKSKLPSSALAKQLALGVRRIVIDPGHGGRDFGAPGYLKGVHEKDITLQIAKRLAKKIKTELKCEVILTRNNDRFLTLEERTAIANTQNADLFISIHTNAHKDRRAYGIETYFLNLATDDDAIRVAAMENATSTKNISDLQKILFDLMQNAKINESSSLASFVQVSMVNHLNQKGFSRIKDKGVKQAPFYVLLGAQMPAILVETAFISNPRECERLLDPGYQERLCEAIVKGIREYIREITPTALIEDRPDADTSG
jgi:N-acetylmuramoyl-L-alanine amidase